MLTTFKRYLSLLLPLCALLVGFECILLVNRALSSHEEVIGKNYAIVLVSSNALDEAALKAKNSQIARIHKLDANGILGEINAGFSDNSKIENFEVFLPLFYSITLKRFPNQREIKQIEADLLAIEGVSRVESFSKSHSQTYRLLVLVKGAITLFSILVGILSVFLMYKQIEVWRFEHSERMEIMTYLGAKSQLKNKPLYQLAFIDSIIAAILVVGFIFWLSNTALITQITSLLGIDIFSAQRFVVDFVCLLFIAWIISMAAVLAVIFVQKEP